MRELLVLTALWRRLERQPVARACTYCERQMVAEAGFAFRLYRSGAGQI
jgi:hypothetical protein